MTPSSTIRTGSGAQHAAISGIGGYRPSRVVTNEEICRHIDSSDEWILTRSGIIERKWAEPHETVQMMSVATASEPGTRRNASCTAWNMRSTSAPRSIT